MESTLADIKQLFNVKAIAYATKLDALPDNSLAIFAEGSDTSIATSAALPAKFRIMSKVNGKMYYSFDTIDKATIQNAIAKDYVAHAVNKWETTINKKCVEFDSLKLVLNLDETTLNMRDGLTWTHRDTFVQVLSSEIKCEIGEDIAIENNYIVKAFVDKVKLDPSAFYEVQAQKADGTVVTDIDAFIVANKAAETKELLKLVVVGKPQLAKPYKDLDIDYVFPRGVQINPVIEVNGGYDAAIQFTETQALVYELGAGADLRREEFDNMNYYTGLNFNTQICGGIADPNLVYQFENGVNYKTAYFEFTTPNVERNSGRRRMFGVLLATSDNTIFTKFKTLLGI